MSSNFSWLSNRYTLVSRIKRSFDAMPFVDSIDLYEAFAGLLVRTFKAKPLRKFKLCYESNYDSFFCYPPRPG